MDTCTAPAVAFEFPPQLRMEPGDLRVSYFIRISKGDGSLVRDIKFDTKVVNAVLRGEEASIRQRLYDFFEAQLAYPWKDMAEDYARERSDSNNLDRVEDPDFVSATHRQTQKSVDWNRPIVAGQYHPMADCSKACGVHSYVPGEPFGLRDYEQRTGETPVPLETRH